MHSSANVTLHNVVVQQINSCTNEPHHGIDHGKIIPQELARRVPRVSWAQDIIIIGTPEKPINHGDSDTPMKNDWACMEIMKMDFLKALEKTSLRDMRLGKSSLKGLSLHPEPAQPGMGKPEFPGLATQAVMVPFWEPCLEGVAWRPARVGKECQLH